MSALDILNEIKGDLPAPDQQDNEITSDPITLSPALEALQSQVETIDKKVTLHKLIDSVRSSERVSKELAMEVFTMLPPMVSIQNHLTSSPSAYNKTFVLDRIVPYDNREEIRDFLNTLCQELYQVEETALKIKQLSATYLSLCQPEFERLDKCPPIVVYPGGKFNLLMDHLERIVEVADSLYNYEPYEGVLTQKFQQVLWSDATKLLKERQYHGNGEINLLSVLSYLRSIADYYADIEKHIAALKDKLSSYNSTGGIRYVIDDAIAFIRNIPVDHMLFDGKDCIAERVYDLVKFLK